MELTAFASEHSWPNYELKCNLFFFVLWEKSKNPCILTPEKLKLVVAGV